MTRVVHALTKQDERSFNPDLLHDLQNRLLWLKRQFRGIQQMGDEQSAREDLLIQTSAVRAALN